MTRWCDLALEELAVSEPSAISKPYGSAFTKEDYRVDGIPVVRGVNLARGVFHDADFVYLAESLADRMPGAELHRGDLVVTHRGTVGQVSMIPRQSRYMRYVASTSHVKVRLDPKTAHPEFYYYWFLSAAGQYSILENASTVGVPGIAQPVSTVKRLRVPHPPLETQRAIAEVLGALDDKIAANAREVQLADDLAGTLFVAGLEVGSEERHLGDVATFHNRRRVPLSSVERGARPGVVPYFGAAGRLDYVDEALFDEHLLLVGEDGSVVQGDGRPVTQYIWGPSWVNNHAHVLTGDGITTELLRLAVRRCSVVSLVTGAVQPKISMGNLKTLQLELPTGGQCDLLAEQVDALAAVLRAKTDESRSLAATRDALLPLLMSGKVTVRDAESVVEGVV